MGKAGEGRHKRHCGLDGGGAQHGSWGQHVVHLEEDEPQPVGHGLGERSEKSASGGSLKINTRKSSSIYCIKIVFCPRKQHKITQCIFSKKNSSNAALLMSVNSSNCIEKNGLPFSISRPGSGDSKVKAFLVSATRLATK